MFGTVRRILPRVPPASPYLAAVAAFVQSACVQPTEPHGNIAVARRAWLALNARSYTFEVSLQASMPGTGYYRIRVVDRRAVEAYRPGGEPEPDLNLTIDDIWDEVLAHAGRDLNYARFDRRGVPIEVDIGEWAADGGYRFDVRNFVLSR